MFCNLTASLTRSICIHLQIYDLSKLLWKKLCCLDDQTFPLQAKTLTVLFTIALQLPLLEMFWQIKQFHLISPFTIDIWSRYS